ncbi:MULTISPECIES: type III secretion system gatekeeper subunit SctW [unclassified Providencia]|uniref:type III secretion system gatekeeper subunit SctW n=1 Tax=unclassified Providencia TaxID=2633465 RepID=UPI0012B5AA2F|nr:MULTISPECIES: type III secretion system gatekeeper subunit SctW [unclassified Providencia]MTC23207.1 YopN family type III secretion system gatekeeper subunit [Providencia sp. wls1938]MTC78260.1 YopN family type III secretion system gatekeeper subunit [Providencia sp. wls1916]
MAITPLSYSNRTLLNAQDKSRTATKSSDDSDEAARGAGVIDSSSEYASMAMLAASHVRRGGSKKGQEEEWMRFAERILENNADEKVLKIEGILNRQLMTPQQLRAFLLQFFSDPSDLLMVLAALINRKKLKQEQIDHLQELERLLLTEDTNRTAQAGANIALIAKAFAQTLRESAGNLRTLYREFIGYDGPVVYLYEQWVEEMELAQRENMMRYLARALACDLQALPLGDLNISEFGSFFTRIGRLRELQSLDRTFSQQFLQSGLFRQQASLSQKQLSQNLLPQNQLEKVLSQLFTSGIRSQESFNDKLVNFIQEQLSAMTTDLRARFVQLLIIAFSIIPVAIFYSLEARDELLDQLKIQMDQLLAQEQRLRRQS